MKTKLLFVSGALALASMITPAAAKDWKSVTIALEGGYAPWNLTNADGTLGGFEPELSKVLCTYAKLDCKLIALDWDGMIPALNAGKYDVMMDAVSITPEREKVIAFSIPYAATPAVFAVDKDSDVAKLAGTGSTITLKGDASDKPQVADLRKAMTGKTIGIQTATVYAKFIYDNFKDVATIKEYKTSAERDLDLAAGRIDAAFDDATYFTSAFKTSGNENLAFSGPEIAGSIWGPGEGLGLRQSDTDLKTIFDGAIKKAIADGTIEKLSQKWFGTSVVPK